MEARDGTATSYEEHSTESLTRCVTQLHGLHNAILRELLAVAAEIERRGAFTSDGCKTTAAWLRAHLGLSMKTSTAWAVTAVAFCELPHLATAFAAGEISFDKAAAVAQVASADSDERLTEAAKFRPVTALEAEARRHREVSPATEQRVRRRRALRWAWRDDESRLTFGGDLSAEEGWKFIKAIDRIADKTKADGDGQFLDLTTKRADALIELCETRLSEDTDPARSTVLINVDLDTAGRVVRGEGLEGGVFSSEAMQRVMCDCRVHAVINDAEGTPLVVSDGTSSIPAWLCKMVALRDRECRFPGCHNMKFLDRHHIEWRTHGGKHSADNVGRWCRMHHRLFHEGGWTIRGKASGDLEFIRPDGKMIREGPPPLDYDVKKWLWEDLMGFEVAAGPDPPVPVG
jgi:hypothetical protein